MLAACAALVAGCMIALANRTAAKKAREHHVQQ
jgi:hypothetical protein